VKVSSGNTLWDFKLRLVEALNIHPKNAEVHIHVGAAWQKLLNDEATLAGDSIFALLLTLIRRPCTRTGGERCVMPGSDLANIHRQLGCRITSTFSHIFWRPHTVGLKEGDAPC
jgi:hypothetical protein